MEILLLILKIAGLTVTGILLLVFLFLLIPIRYRFGFRLSDQSGNAFLEITYFFSALRIFLSYSDFKFSVSGSIFGKKLTAKKKTARTDLVKPKKQRSKKRKTRKKISVNQLFRAMDEIRKELKKVVKKIYPKSGEGVVTIGFQKPDLTGKVMALLLLLRPQGEERIRIVPDFENRAFHGNGEWKGKFSLLSVSASLVKIGFNP